MIFVIDVDDTLNNLHKLRFKIGKKYIKDNKLNYKVINKHTNYFSKMFNWPKKIVRTFWHTAGNELIANAPLMRGAKEVLNYLHSENHKIIILTARDEYWHIKPFEITEQWLKNSGIPFSTLIVGFRDNKEEMFKKFNPDFVIEDSIENCQKCIDLNINFIVMEGKHNKNLIPKNWQKAKNWHDVKKIVIKKAETL